MTTEIGKITRADFGWGGYQDAMIGFSFTLEGKAWGVSDFKGGAWGSNRHEVSKWSEESRVTDIGEACLFVRDLLTKAKKQSLHDLIGIPIEATFDDYIRLSSWRILEEVL